MKAVTFRSHASPVLVRDTLTYGSGLRRVDTLASTDDFDFWYANTRQEQEQSHAPPWILRVAEQMLTQARLDLSDARERPDAVKWVTDDAVDHPWSFESCCDILRLKVDVVREQFRALIDA